MADGKRKLTLSESTVEDSLGDLIASAVLSKYNELGKSGKPNATEWTVLAGIVVSRSEAEPSRGSNTPTTFSVLAVTTGNKCLSESKLRGDGRVLHDSHAEALSRRALVHFLQSETRMLLERFSSSGALPRDSDEFFRLDGGILTAVRKGSTVTFATQAGLSFHLYVSQAPCGDASIFNSAETARCVAGEDHTNNKRVKISTDDKRMRTTESWANRVVTVDDGVQRTGAKAAVNSHREHEASSGDAPKLNQQQEGIVRIKPGRGERTRSMSCSDKIARWNVLGLQGGLLADILGPIYLSFAVHSPSLHASSVPFPSSRESVETEALGQLSAAAEQQGHVDEGKKKQQRVSCNPAGSSMNWSATAGPLVWVTAAELRSMCASLKQNGGRAVSGGGGKGAGGVEATIGATGSKAGTTKKNEGTDASMSRLSRRAMLQRDAEIRRLLSRVTASDETVSKDRGERGGPPPATGEVNDVAKDRADAASSNASGSTQKPESNSEEGTAVKISYREAKRRCDLYREARGVLLGEDSPFCEWLTNAEDLGEFQV